MSCYQQWKQGLSSKDLDRPADGHCLVNRGRREHDMEQREIRRDIDNEWGKWQLYGGRTHVSNVFNGTFALCDAILWL